jgi:DNA mismatch repair protein MutS2
MNEKSARILEFDKVLEQLAELTSFSAGAELARALLPVADAELANRWQLETTEARTLLDRRSDVTIGGARDVRMQADRAERGFVLDPTELLDVRATIIAARQLRRKLLKAHEEYPNLAAVAELIEECPGIVSAIGGALDERGEVLDSASDKLASIRRQLRIVHNRIHEKLRALLSGSQNVYLQEPTITSRGGRYVVPLKANYKGRIKGIVHDQSNSGATLWIEPFNTVDLNNEFRSLGTAEEEEIRRILSELSGLVGEQADPVKRVVDRLAEIDLIFARARYAERLDAVMPELVAWRKRPKLRPNQKRSAEEAAVAAALHPGSTIWVRGARHPLLDPDTVVPTDLLVNEDIFIVLITGPNTGGKTVSLKTTGLMALMAQSGLQLPAVEARLTVFDTVFADIGDEQSIEQNLSTFSGHMTNIVNILKEANERSLVLLDELGSGTDPAEGAALAQAIVGYLRDQGATTFVATHYPELKVYASQTPGATNASLLFDLETLMPTYEMSIGVPGRSNAFAIARRLGLDETVLADGLDLLGGSSTRAEGLLESIYEMREQIASQEAGTRLALRQAEEERQALQERLDNIAVEQQEALQESREQGRLELEALREEIRKARKKLRDAESLNKLKKLQKKSEKLEAQIPDPPDHAPDLVEPSKPRKKPDDLQVGDTVFVSSLGKKGTVVDLGKHEAEVAVGRLRMRAQLDELVFKERPQEKGAPQPEAPLPDGRSAGKSPGLELDLRGKRVDEGLGILEQYLDSAFLAELPWVRIIHGKGTGRMREAVRDELKRNSHVASWEEGHDGEGGAGVTVAKLAIE